MSFPLFNGLGGELVETGSQAGMSTQNQFLTGSLVVAGTVTNTGAITATAGVTTPASVTFNAGSPYNVGIIIPMTARALISGGMWVAGSGGLALPSAASAKTAIGVAQSTAQSGATVNVIVCGIVPMVADGTVLHGGGVQIGAGAALNTVSPHVAGSAYQYATLSPAASGGTVFVVL